MIAALQHCIGAVACKTHLALAYSPTIFAAGALAVKCKFHAHKSPYTVYVTVTFNSNSKSVINSTFSFDEPGAFEEMRSIIAVDF